MVQVPVLLRDTEAVETPVPSIEEAPAEQGPVVVKVTSWLFGMPAVLAVAVT